MSFCTDTLEGERNDWFHICLHRAAYSMCGKNGNTLHLSRNAKDSGLQCVFTFHFLFITDMFDKRGSSVQDCLILHSKRNKKELKMLHKDHDMG